VIQGTIFPAGHITEPGVVNQDAGGKTWLGPFEVKPATMEEVEQLADALNRSGMDCLAMEDARGAQWTKVIFNSASNAMAALTRLPHLDSDPEALLDYGREKAYYHPPSMLQDVWAERLTEVDALNGGIARLGKKLGIPCPMNEACAAIIKGLEASWTLEYPEN